MINGLHKNAGTAFPAIPGCFWGSNNPRKIEPPWAVERDEGRKHVAVNEAKFPAACA